MSVKIPFPAFVRLNPPLIIPPIVKAFVKLFVVIVLFPLNVTAPVPKFNACVPVNAKSPPHVWVLFLELVMAAAVLLSKVPPFIVKVPVPMALALLKFNVPELRVIPPVKVFAPLRVKIPVPVFVRLNAPPITPPIVSAFVALFVVTELFALRVTAPVPMFKGLVPVNVNAPPHDWGLFTRVMLPPLVLSMVVPFPMASDPTVVPTAAALFKFKVPAVSVNEPV